MAIEVRQVVTVSRLEIIDGRDTVAVPQEAIDQRRSDETGATRDEYLHRALPGRPTTYLAWLGECRQSLLVDVAALKPLGPLTEGRGDEGPDHP